MKKMALCLMSAMLVGCGSTAKNEDIVGQWVCKTDYPPSAQILDHVRYAADGKLTIEGLIKRSYVIKLKNKIFVVHIIQILKLS